MNCHRAAKTPATANKPGVVIDPALTSASEDEVAVSPLPVTVPTNPSSSVVTDAPSVVVALAKVVSVLVMVVSVMQVSGVSCEVSCDVPDGTDVSMEVSSALEYVFSVSVAVVCTASGTVVSAVVVCLVSSVVLAGVSTAVVASMVVVASVLGAPSPGPRSIGFPSSSPCQHCITSEIIRLTSTELICPSQSSTRIFAAACVGAF